MLHYIILIFKTKRLISYQLSASRSHALRGNAWSNALRCRTRSVQTGIPTQSVGTRNNW